MTEGETNEITESGTNVPDDLLYTDEDLWVKIEGNIATIGITDYAQDQLGDIVAVDLPEVGSAAAKGASVGVIESVKAAADLISPLSGTVKEVNSNLTGETPNLEAIKTGPYSTWFIKLETSTPEEKETLLSPEAYKTKIQS